MIRSWKMYQGPRQGTTCANMLSLCVPRLMWRWYREWCSGTEQGPPSPLIDPSINFSPPIISIPIHTYSYTAIYVLTQASASTRAPAPSPEESVWAQGRQGRQERQRTLSHECVFLHLCSFRCRPHAMPIHPRDRNPCLCGGSVK